MKSCWLLATAARNARISSDVDSLRFGRAAGEPFAARGGHGAKRNRHRRGQAQGGGAETDLFEKRSALHGHGMLRNTTVYERSRFDVLVVFCGDLGLPVVACVEVEAVAEGDALARPGPSVAGGLVGQFFEIMLAEGVGGEQPVVAHVPPGGMPGFCGWSKMAMPTVLPSTGP